MATFLSFCWICSGIGSLKKEGGFEVVKMAGAGDSQESLALSRKKSRKQFDQQKIGEANDLQPQGVLKAGSFVCGE